MTMENETECLFCQTRKILRQMSALLDTVPVIGSPFYDDPITDLCNEIANAESTFQCYCTEKV
jgi:hypothetical protein